MEQQLTLRQKAVKGSFWALLERFGRMGVVFVVTLALARLLTPGDYGLVALLTIFINIASVFADVGFGDALIQKKDASDLDFNSVFYLSIVLSTTCYAVLFFCAPAIARFYGNGELSPMLRVLSVTIILGSINSVQCVELKRRLLFDRNFKISMLGLAANGCTGIALAIMGYGPWAIVWSQVVGSGTSVLTYWFLIAWRPKLMFSFKAVRGLFTFSWKIVCVSLIDKAYNNLYGMIIGKLYSPADLALVNRGKGLPSLFMDAINGSINIVTFPAIAQIQEDLPRVRNAMRQMLQCTTFFIFPLMAGLVSCADLVVYLLLGEKWMACVPYVMILCFGYAIYPFHTVNISVFLALGRSDEFLKVEIMKKVVGLTILVVSLRYGIMPFLLATTFLSDPTAAVFNSLPTRKLIGYGIFKQIRDVSKAALAAVLMGGIVYLFSWTHPCVLDIVHNEFATAIVVLTAQVILGAMVYVALSYALRVEALGICLRQFQPKLRRFRLFQWVYVRYAP